MSKELIPLLDLTSLNETDTADTINNLCAAANTPFGPVAAICIYSQFIPPAKLLLANSSIKIATVANFPSGNQNLSETLNEIQIAIERGANEIDVVMPYPDFLAQKNDLVLHYLQQCRKTCGANILLKVILETGVLSKPDLITAAAELAITAGADFIKTSTGKTSQGASLAAAEAMIAAIKKHPHQATGIKFSGGIRKVDQAMAYYHLVETELGKKWLHASRLRFGVSQLLKDILASGQPFQGQ